MRILIATSHRNLAGGVEKYLQQILPCLRQRGHQLALLYEYRFDPQKERVDQLALDIPCLGTEEAGLDAGLRLVTARCINLGGRKSLMTIQTGANATFIIGCN